jgi:hypothetical protein
MKRTRRRKPKICAALTGALAESDASRGNRLMIGIDPNSI